MQPATKGSLGSDVVAAIIRAKNDLAFNRLRSYEGREINDPDLGRVGTNFLEADVGQARPGDPQGPRGAKRLVLKVQNRRIVAMYFSDGHYRPGSWVRIVDF
jgi:hypothetical protein